MMGFRRVARWVLFTAVVVTAGGAAIQSNGIRNLYRELYPADPAKREALELCFSQDHEFNRLDSGERENCYRQVLAPVEARLGSTPAWANPIDLRRAAAAGSMSRNDVRRTEQTQDALHLPH
jgi:hypothetical protein